MSQPTPPNLTESARLVHTALCAERVGGFLPPLATIAICAVHNRSLHVRIGGLTDEFILGGNVHVAGLTCIDPRIFFTPEANRLRHRIEDEVRDYLPRKESGEPWFALHVRLMTEPFWRSQTGPTKGVRTIRKGKKR